MNYRSNKKKERSRSHSEETKEKLAERVLLILALLAFCKMGLKIYFFCTNRASRRFTLFSTGSHGFQRFSGLYQTVQHRFCGPTNQPDPVLKHSRKGNIFQFWCSLSLFVRTIKQAIQLHTLDMCSCQSFSPVWNRFHFAIFNVPNERFCFHF